jgi:hypothetical protein
MFVFVCVCVCVCVYVCTYIENTFYILNTVIEHALRSEHDARRRVRLRLARASSSCVEFVRRVRASSSCVEFVRRVIYIYVYICVYTIFWVESVGL